MTSAESPPDELVPEVLDALVTLFERVLSPGPTGRVQVILGPPNEWLQPELVAVGINTQDVAPVEASNRRVGFGAQWRDEFDVTCLAHVRSGSQDMRVVTRRVFDLVRAIRGGLARDQTLGGFVLDAHVASTAYLPRRENGAVAVVEFAVRVMAVR